MQFYRRIYFGWESAFAAERKSLRELCHTAKNLANQAYKDSNGNETQYPRYYRQAEKRLKSEQRKLSKM